MKSLLFDARMKRDSGIGVYIQNLLPDLKTNFNLTLLGSDEADIPMEAPIYSIAEQVAFSRLKRSFDLMWSPHYNVPILNPARKSIVTIHDVFHLAFFASLPLKQKIYARLMLKKAAASDLILTVSEFSKNEISKYLGTPLKKIHVVYNGIDAQHFSQQYRDSERKALAAKYDLGEEYVLFVGNVKPHKNLRRALLGFQIYKENRSGSEKLKFVIVGKRDGFITGDTEVATLCNEPFFYKNVRFTGWVPDSDLPFIYQQAKVFMFTSLYEGFGFPPLEAMAAGCPVISSDSACMPEIYGDAALYFNASAPESGAEALSKVLDGTLQDRSSLIERGHLQAARYTWTKSTTEAIDLVNRLL